MNKAFVTKKCKQVFIISILYFKFKEYIAMIDIFIMVHDHYETLLKS